MMTLKELLANHGDELLKELSQDGRDELKAGLAKDGEFFRFFPEDQQVFNAWIKKHTSQGPTFIPRGQARKYWKKYVGTDREPEDFYTK